MNTQTKPQLETLLWASKKGSQSYLEELIARKVGGLSANEEYFVNAQIWAESQGFENFRVVVDIFPTVTDSSDKCFTNNPLQVVK